MPWSRFLWIFYFTDKFKESPLFSLNANCYSVIALILFLIYILYILISYIANESVKSYIK